MEDGRGKRKGKGSGEEETEERGHTFREYDQKHEPMGALH